MTRIAICICTYKRPAMLRRLLSFLPDAPVIVVDNDAARSAESVCADFNVTYACEPRRGISHARNTALRLAQGAELIACIDDDEYPSSGWLPELLKCQERFDADIVIGPVLPEFNPSTPGWIKEGGFFSRPRYDTGASIPLPYSSNMLIHKRVIVHDEVFNPDYGLTGAEDTDFFMRVRRRGARIVYSNEAIAYETIPLERCSPRYLRRRAFAGGSNFTAITVSRGTSRIMRGVKAIARIGLGVSLLPFTAMRDKAKFISAQQHIWKGLGTLSALLGQRYLFYR